MIVLTISDCHKSWSHSAIKATTTIDELDPELRGCNLLTNAACTVAFTLTSNRRASSSFDHPELNARVILQLGSDAMPEPLGYGNSPRSSTCTLNFVFESVCCASSHDACRELNSSVIRLRANDSERSACFATQPFDSRSLLERHLDTSERGVQETHSQ